MVNAEEFAAEGGEVAPAAFRHGRRLALDVRGNAGEHKRRREDTEFIPHSRTSVVLLSEVYRTSTPVREPDVTDGVHALVSRSLAG